MNKKILIGAFALLAVFGTACDDHLDVNHDPNVLGELPDASVVLPAAELNLANTLMGWEFGFEGGFWSEYWTQTYDASQFKTLCQYESQSAATAYNNLTAGVLMDLKTIKEMTAENNKGLYYISEALSIYTWQMIVDMWGDIPYTEALKGGESILSPVFDDDEEIYSDLMTRIDALLAMDLSSASVDGTYDVIFGGDLAKWQQFAASVKLKLIMRQAETSGYSASSTVAFIEANEFLTAKSAMIPAATWSNDQEGKRHPMMEFEKGGAGYLDQNVIGCQSFINYLTVGSDPRLDVYFNATASDGHHEGAFFGDFESKEDTDGDGTDDTDEDYSQPDFSSTQDLMFMSAWEVNFFIAEAYARNGNSDQAKAYYEAGVKASLEQNGITDFSILDGYAEWTDGTVDEEVKQIMMQKWVANCNYQHIESWLERNRTKFPEIWDRDIKVDRSGAYTAYIGSVNTAGFQGYLTISVVGRGTLSGKLPTLLIYPTSITQRNSNAPDNRSTLSEGKAWWNQKGGL